MSAVSRCSAVAELKLSTQADISSSIGRWLTVFDEGISTFQARQRQLMLKQICLRPGLCILTPFQSSMCFLAHRCGLSAELYMPDNSAVLDQCCWVLIRRYATYELLQQ